LEHSKIFWANILKKKHKKSSKSVQIRLGILKTIEKQKASKAFGSLTFRRFYAG